MRKGILYVLVVLFALIIGVGRADATAPPEPSDLAKKFASGSNNSYSEAFSLRNGISWGDSEQEFEDKLSSEGITEIYSLFELEEFDVYSMFPHEKGKNEMWYPVTMVSLGKDDSESVLFTGIGTKKTGLFNMSYIVDVDEGTCYQRAKELVAELENKYGKFKTQGSNKNYRAWITLSDGTLISFETLSEIEFVIDYRSPSYEEINKSLQDGSYYIETSYGL